MKNTRLVWRLNQLPDADEITNLLEKKVITHEEARQILFRTETEEDRDKKSLESEIKFLRELIEKLANRSQIITTVKEIIPSYGTYRWSEPYKFYCTDGTTYTTSGGTYTSGASNILNTVAKNFSDITTW